MTFPKAWADTVARLRVPSGFLLAGSFAVLARPAPESLGLGVPVSIAGLMLARVGCGPSREEQKSRDQRTLCLHSQSVICRDSAGGGRTCYCGSEVGTGVDLRGCLRIDLSASDSKRRAAPGQTCFRESFQSIAGGCRFLFPGGHAQELLVQDASIDFSTSGTKSTMR